MIYHDFKFLILLFKDVYVGMWVYSDKLHKLSWVELLLGGAVVY